MADNLTSEVDSEKNFLCRRGKSCLAYILYETGIRGRYCKIKCLKQNTRNNCAECNLRIIYVFNHLCTASGSSPQWQLRKLWSYVAFSIFSDVLLIWSQTLLATQAYKKEKEKERKRETCLPARIQCHIILIAVELECTVPSRTWWAI